MSTLATLNVVLNGDIGGFLKAMKQAEGQSQSSGGLIGRALGTIGDVAKVAGAAAVAGIGMAVGAAVGGVTAFNNWADTLDSLGDVLGTSADESAGLAVAIRTVGGDVDGITGQMAKLVKGLETTAGKAGPTGKMLEKLGVNAYNANGSLKSSTEILTAVADRLSKMPDGLEKTAAMTTLFGKSGKDLADTMDALANGGLKNAEEKARALGLAIGEDGVNKSIEFGKSFETVKLALEGLAVSVGSVLMPVILPVIQKLSEWAVQVMPQLRQGIETAFTWIQTNVAPIIAQMIAAFQTAVAWVQTNWPAVRDTVIGVFEQIKAVVGPVIDAISGVITSVFGAIATFIGSHGEEIKGFVSTTWTDISNIVTTLVTLVSAVITTIFNTIKQFITDHGAQLQIIFDTMWQQIRIVVETAINLVKNIIGTVMAIIRGDWATVWNNIKAAVAIIWNAITTLWKNFWTGVQNVLLSMGVDVQKAWDGFWGGIRETVTAIWNGIKMFIQNAVNGVIDIINGMIQGFNDSLGQLTGQLALIPHVNLFGAGQAAGQSYAAGVAAGFGTQPALAFALSPASRGSGGGGYGGIVVNVNVDRITSDVDVENLAVRVAREIRERR